MSIRVVVVDDEEDVRLFCKVVMERLGYQVISCASGDLAIAHLSENSADLLITDASMPGMSGMELIERAKGLDPSIATLVITGYGTMEMAFRAIRAGAQGFLPKPFSVKDLCDATNHALAQASKAREYASMKAMMPLVELSRSLSGETSLAKAGARITELVCRVCQVDGAGIILSSLSGDQRLLGRRGIFPDFLSPCCAHENNGMEAASVKSLPDTPFKRSLEESGVEYLASVSLEAPSGHIGVILLTAAKGPIQFTRSAQQFLEAMSAQVAASLDNIRMLDELRIWNRELEVRVEERTVQLETAQEQLIKAQRLATIGELGASIAHEMRNPLGVISNSEYYLRMRLGEGDAKISKHLDIIKREVAASNAIITELMSFVRATSLDVTAVDPRMLLERCIQRADIPEGIAVLCDWPDNLPIITADEDRLEIVLMNLVNNAVQAMPQGGKLIVTARPSDRDLVLSVEDTGAGIPEKNMTRIFEPLFTTKAKGIGLGLAIVRRLVQAHGGEISVTSQTGQGTRFELSIPISVPDGAETL